MNYELLIGLIADKVSEKILSSELIKNMGIDNPIELESLLYTLLVESTWSVIKIDGYDAFLYKSIRGRGFLKRKDVRELCSENLLNISDFLERVNDIMRDGLDKIANKYSGSTVNFDRGNADTLLGVEIKNVTDIFEINRDKLKRALNKHLDSTILRKVFEGRGRDLSLMEIIKTDVIMWDAIPQEVFYIREDVLKKIKNMELSIDFLMDSMSDKNYISGYLKREKIV